LKAAELARELIGLLERLGHTVSFAESCTGGLVSACITSVPGASVVYKGGIVAYANEIKQAMLDVDPEILDSKGSVSMECAEAMARSAAVRFATDYALSVTGIAGPEGGSAEKPVGTVWFGLAARGRISAVKACFPGNRTEIRAAATQKGLELIVARVKTGFELDNPADGGVSLGQA